MRSILYLVLILMTISSCQYEEIKYLGVSRIGNVHKDGKTIDLDVDIKINNPNTYAVKIKPSTVDVLINDAKVGVVHLTDKIKLVKKTEGIYTAQLGVELEKINLIGLATNALFGKTTICFKGKVKAGVAGFYKKFDLNEKRDLDISQIKRLIEKFSL